MHAIVHAINAALSNVGNTLYYTEPVEANPVSYVESLRELCADMDAGKVDTLLMVGVNPVYDAPHDFDFTNKLLQSAQHRAAEHAFRRDRAACEVARRRVALPRNLGRCARVRRYCQRDPAADRAAVLHALGARCDRGVQRQAGNYRVRRGARPVESDESGGDFREILAQDPERRFRGQLGVLADQRERQGEYRKPARAAGRGRRSA